MTRRHTVRGAALAVLFLAGVGPGCGVPRPSDLPADEPWIVAVKSARVPFDRWYSFFAHHSWIDVKHGGVDAWRRIEIRSRRAGVGIVPISDAEARQDVWYERRPVHVLGYVIGEDARRVAERIEAAASAHHEKYTNGYTLWPGPNSNTFIADLACEFDELCCVLDPNAIGKDYGGWFRAGLATSKTGVRVDTPIVGAAIGLKEGVELHLFGLTFGVSVWPPGVQLPFLPRIPDGLFLTSEPGVPPMPPSSRITVRVDLDPKALEKPDDAIEHKAADLPLRGRVVLVDSTTGEWTQASYRFSQGAAPEPPWSVEIDTSTRGITLELDHDQEFSGPLDESRAMQVGVATGAFDVELRFALASKSEESAAAVYVRATLRSRPENTSAANAKGTTKSPRIIPRGM